MKKALEIVALVFVLAIALWLGAFLLRDKSEFFCQMSFGEYRIIPEGGPPRVPEGYRATRKCLDSFIVNLYNK